MYGPIRGKESACVENREMARKRKSKRDGGGYKEKEGRGSWGGGQMKRGE